MEPELIVVDDGSTDQTASLVVQRPQVILLRHPTNLGKGSAIRTGFTHATGDLVLIQDADLEYDPSNYPALLEPFATSGARVVYGSRFKTRSYPSGMQLPNYVANRFGTWLSNRLYGASVSDAATGYKAFHRDVLGRIELVSSGFEVCTELTAKTRRLGIPIVEVPITYRARSRAQGKKFLWRHGFQILVEIVKYA